MDGMNFDSLEYYVIYMRYKRSGSALLVNLLDAHPNAIFVRNEELYAKYQRWEHPEQIFNHLYNYSKRYRNRPYSANGYKYPIEGVGYAENPLIIGHKSSTRQFLPVAQGQKRLNEFQRAVGLPLKFLHLVRNPYNQVNARWQQKEFRRKNAPLDEIIAHVSEQTEGNYKMRVKAGDYYQIHYEDLMWHITETMSALCDFLELPIVSKHMQACRDLVRIHHEIVAPTWTDATKAQVRGLCEDYPEFYGRYL